SSGGNDFNADYGVFFNPEDQKSQVYNYGTMAPGFSDREGISVFYKDSDGSLFHTYSTYARGLDMMNTAYHYIDLTPKGRDEGDGRQRWVRRHAEYGRCDGPPPSRRLAGRRPRRPRLAHDRDVAAHDVDVGGDDGADDAAVARAAPARTAAVGGDRRR